MDKRYRESVEANGRQYKIEQANKLRSDQVAEAARYTMGKAEENQ